MTDLDRPIPSDRGICDLCEQAPVDGDDCFCVTCRIEVTAMSEITHSPVERVLTEHWHVCFLSDMDATLCRCGARFPGGPGYHRRHVAELIHGALGLDEPMPWTSAGLEAGQEQP